jgi:hypothetical protein
MALLLAKAKLPQTIIHITRVLLATQEAYYLNYNKYRIPSRYIGARLNFEYALRNMQVDKQKLLFKSRIRESPDQTIVLYKHRRARQCPVKIWVFYDNFLSRNLFIIIEFLLSFSGISATCTLLILSMHIKA